MLDYHVMKVGALRFREYTSGASTVNSETALWRCAPIRFCALRASSIVVSQVGLIATMRLWLKE
ncbi:MAG: hypothetical protein OJF49_001526 [Ktedonobacterales bacterium]|nr:MAG: hypothetical protein OJF49_001526 [Ktedonobacterales bacterium]